MVVEQHVNQQGRITDTDFAVSIDIATMFADITITIQQVINQQGHVTDIDIVIMVYITSVEDNRTVVKQSYFLNVTPSALGAIGVVGLHLIEVGAFSQQVVHSVGLVGNASNQTVGLVALLGSTQLGSGNLARIDLNPLNLGIIGMSKELNLVILGTVQDNSIFCEITGEFKIL